MLRCWGMVAMVTGMAVTLAPAVRAQDVAAPDAGMTVMTRGPVHEAFAEPTVRKPGPSPVVEKQPPDPIPEVPSDQKPTDDNAVWIPGYWAWDQDQSQYLWLSGIWCVPPPGLQWVPGYWSQADGGWQWVAGYWGATDAGQVQYLPQPPDPVAEATPPAPDDASTYVPGCWVFTSNQYAWRPGFWVALRPNWVWVNACYYWTPAGWVFVDGHWDYALANRGLLFAPVYFTEALWQRPGWFYRPSYVVYDNFLLGALFVRIANRHYYFGDYYDPAYARAGFMPWVDFHRGNVYDPLLGYYSWANRGNPRWERDLRQLYTTRIENRADRPARTLAQQTTLVQNITKNTTTVNNVTNLTAVAPLAKVDRNVVKLQPVAKERLTEVRKHAEALQATAKQRSQGEVHLRQQASETPAAERKPATMKLAVPKAPLAAREGTRVAPPRPAHPEPKPHPAAQTQPTPRPTAKPEPKPEPRPAPKAEPKPAPRPEPKPVPKAEPKPEPKPAPKPEPKPAPKPEPKPVPKPEPKPAPKPEPKPAPTAEVRPQAPAAPFPAPAPPHPITGIAAIGNE